MTTESVNLERKLRTWASWIMLAAALVFIAWQGTVLQKAKKKTEVTEEARKVERLRAELIVMTNPLAAIMCGVDGKITFVNIEAERLFGYKYDELLGKKARILLPEEYREAHDAAMSMAIERTNAIPEGKNWVIRRARRVKGLRKDGTEFDIELGVRTIRYAGNVEFIATMQYPRSPFMDTEADIIKLPNLEQRIQESQERVKESMKAQ